MGLRYLFKCRSEVKSGEKVIQSKRISKNGGKKDEEEGLIGKMWAEKGKSPFRTLLFLPFYVLAEPLNIKIKEIKNN